jgi:hypothetical protein
MDVQVKDSPTYHTTWTCEKWSEEAVDFARRKLESWGITHVPAELIAGENVEMVYKRGVLVPGTKLDKVLSAVFDRPIVTVARQVPRMMPIEEGISSEMLRLIIGEAEIVEVVEGNLLLNEGIQRLEDLSMIATVLSNQVAGNPWSNGNAFLGVGDSSTAEAATQTELQAATNRFYKAMNATFPSRSSQTVTFQSDFTSAEANYVWAEWAIAAGATTASGSGFTSGTTNLNRKVAALGTKSTGTWTLSAQLTLA